MNTRNSTLVGTAFVLSLLVPIGACGSGTTVGSGEPAGTGGSHTGGSNTGGSNTGGSSTGGTSTGGSAAGGSGTGGSEPSTVPATFASVRVVVDFYCGGSSCHGAKETAPNIAHVADDATLYKTLTTFKSMKCGNRVLVKPSSPQDSAFYLAQMGMCGTLEKMPKGCNDQNCTAPEYLEAIRLWIASGAPAK